MNASMYRCIALSAVFLLASSAMAQTSATYPTRPIRMIVPSAPGSGPDIMARAIGQKLTEAYGQQVVIDDKPGAGGIIGSEAAAKSAPDGYTLIMANAGSHAVNASLYSRLPYDPVRDFAPITLVSSAPNILIVHPSLPVKSVKDLIALAKSKPGQLAFGSGGNGSTAHLSGEMFKTMAGIDIVHVPFKGSPSAVLAVISGQIAMAMPNIPPALPHVKTGKLKALAVTTAKRSAAVPELPTVAESGLPGYEATAWFGVLAPAGTPRDIIDKLNGVIVKSLRAPDMQQRLLADGAEAVGSTPDQFAALIRRDIAKWAVVVKSSGARAD
ncbi:MAG TPA: tripartite tricarboxylate transporter substrate binding protein [Burkholderiales bacterium]|nr:tripartite tricarboxylate transporter substrate binding protein [Burkholderiales bacterium]